MVSPRPGSNSNSSLRGLVDITPAQKKISSTGECSGDGGGGGFCYLHTLLPRLDEDEVLASKDERSRGNTLNRPLESVVLATVGTMLLVI